ncbi:MAG: DUF2020 domain-containing protein [Pseudonocardiaceae bacterium]
MSPSPHRRPIIATLAAGLVGLVTGVGTVACSVRPVASPPVEQGGPPAQAPPVDGPPGPPPAPQPVADGPCSYLSAAAVQAANGERVAKVRVSGTSPHPACFFYAGNGTVQLRTWIVVATPGVAGATVDAAAPVASSDRVELSGGWSGGSQPTADGAVFAVARQGTAVVITTNQRQTISARQIAEQVIAALRL